MKNFVSTKIHTALKTPEIMGSFYVTVGMLTGSVFSYLLLFFLGRTLSIEDFGSFNALLSLTYIITIPAGVLNTSIVKKVSEILSQKDFDRLTSLFWKLIAMSFILGLVMFTLVFLLKSLISQTLRVFNISAVFWFGLSILFTFSQVVLRSYLQGLLRYKAFSVLNIAAGVLRFGFPALLVWMGYKLTGSFIGLTLSVISIMIVGYLLLKKNLTEFKLERSAGDLKNILVFSIPVAFMNTGLMLLNNVDMIMVKNFFDPKTSGYYAGVITLGKIFLFGAGTVYIVMFPVISGLHTKGAKYLNKFYNFLTIQVLLILGGIIAFSVFPRFITLLFFGERFKSSIEYLPLFSIFVGAYVFSQFMIMFFMAVNKTAVSLLFIPVVLMQIILIYFFHENLYSVIHINIFVSLILCILLVSYFFLSIIKNRNSAPVKSY